MQADVRAAQGYRPAQEAHLAFQTAATKKRVALALPLAQLTKSSARLQRSQQCSPTAPMGSPRVVVGQSWWPGQDLLEDSLW